jgi:hypothetical protein
MRLKPTFRTSIFPLCRVCFAEAETHQSTSSNPEGALPLRDNTPYLHQKQDFLDMNFMKCGMSAKTLIFHIMRPFPI